MNTLIDRIKTVFARIAEVYEGLDNPIQAEYVMGELEGVRYCRDVIKATPTLTIARAEIVKKMGDTNISVVRVRGFFNGCAIALALFHDIETTA